MNRIKIFSAVVLAVSVSVCAFSSCKKDEPVQTATSAAQTTEQISTTKNNGYSYVDKVFIGENQTQYVHVEPSVPAMPQSETAEKSTAVQSAVTDASTKKASSASVDEQANGLDILSKTNPVTKGNNASIIISGTPGAEYTIEFYESDTKKAAYSGLEATKADSSGIASWSFTVEGTCESGERKVIIRERNSDKYIQTSINIL